MHQNFFRNYPFVDYKLDSKTSIKVQDFLRVQTLDKQSLLDAGYVNDYDIEQGETAAHISNKLYGTPSYDWTIYAINGIVNWYNDTPLADDVLRLVAFQKYYFKVYSVDEDTGEMVYDETRTTDAVLKRIDFIGDVYNNHQMTVDYDENGNTLTFGPHHWDIDTILSDDENPILKPVSCMQYEYVLNEAKRRILVLRKDSLQNIVNRGLTDIRV